MKIAVVGAQGTGKTTLVHALRLALHADADADADVDVDVDVAESPVTENWALKQHRRYDLTLLMGLDLAWQDRDQSPQPAQHDAHLRQVLDSHAIAYAVVYGTGQARTDCALQAIAFQRTQSRSRPRPAASVWQWCCDTCSDAACEHRLFTALVNNQASVRA
jgi:ATPase subunit of ABC transporter with duplicated ATPase domains